MSDLSNLFKSPITKKSLSASHYQSPRTPFSILGSRSERCEISDFQEKVRLGVRKQVKAQSMTDELNIFYQMQREIIFVKIMVSGLFASLLYTSNIQRSLNISIIMLVASQLLSTTVLPLQNSMLSNTLKKAQYLIYFSAFYTLLKWATDTKHHQIHWPFTLIATTATFAHLILRFYSPFFFVSARNIIGEAVRSKKIIGKVLIFPKYLIHRVRMVLGLAKYLIIMVSIFLIVSLLILAYFNQLSMQFFQLSNILVSIPIFFFLELFIDVLTFMNTVLSKDLKLSMIMKDRIPMFLNLLRLQYQPQNRKVQLQCLKSIYIKIYQTSNFLSNQTNKSLIYTTYMDIFNQFTVLELERVSSLIMEFNTNAKINDKVTTLEKSILQDIFILFRKVRARFTSEYKMLELVEVLYSLNFLFLIINKIEKENEEQEVKVSGRIMHLVKAIKERLGECTQRISLSSYVRGELTSLYLNFTSYQFWIKDQQL